MAVINWEHDLQAIQKLGDGSFASVYLCKRRHTGQLFVVKSVPLSECSYTLSTVSLTMHYTNYFF